MQILPGAFRTRPLYALALALTYTLAACTPELTNAEARDVKDYRLALTNGNNQSGPAGQRLPINLSAIVTHTDGVLSNSVIGNQSVTYTITSGGGSLVPTIGPSGATIEVMTSQAGEASIAWVLGPGTGPQTVTARITGGNETAVVTYSAMATATVGSVTISPDGAQVLVGAQVTFATTRRDVNGVIIANGDMAFAYLDPTILQPVASDPNVGTVTVRALAPGTGRIIASSAGKADTVVVVVIAPPAAVATLVLTPATATVAIGGTQAFTAATRDAQGNLLTGRVIAFSSSDTVVAKVDASGIVTARAAGVASVFAISEGKADTSIVTVPAAAACVAGAVCTVAISTNGNATQVQVGHTLFFQAILKDMLGAQMTTGQTVTYTSSNLAIARVDPPPPNGPEGYFGLMAGVSAGQATITATTSNGRSGTFVINVVP